MSETPETTDGAPVEPDPGAPSVVYPQADEPGEDVQPLPIDPGDPQETSEDGQAVPSAADGDDELDGQAEEVTEPIGEPDGEPA